MRGTDYNTGLRGVLFEARHFERMGSAVWLYGWLVLRQTHQSEGLGWVLGGAPVCYREIEEETGFNRRTLERWMHALRTYGYIQTEAVPGGVVIRITKAKKFAHPPRKVAEGARNDAGEGTQNGVAIGVQVHSHHKDSAEIRSTSIADIKQRADAHDFHSGVHRDFHRQTANPSCLGKNQNRQANSETQVQPNPHPISSAQEQYNFLQEARLRVQLLRAEREDAVRRELNVGRGPELRRS